MRFPRLRLSRRRVIVLLLVGLAAGAYLAWLRQKPRENPTLAGVPLQERLKGLESKDAVDRKRTLYTLAAFGPKAKGALPELLKLLLDDREELWREAALAVGRIGEAAIPELRKVLDEKAPSRKEEQSQWFGRRHRVAVALGFAGPGAVPHLRGLLVEPNPPGDDGGRTTELDKTARDSLARIAAEHPQTVPELVGHLREPKLWDGGVAVELYSSSKRSPEAARVWASVLDHPDPTAQLIATHLLVRADVLDPRMIPSLAKFVRSGEVAQDDYRQRLLLLHRAGHDVVPAVAARWREQSGKDGDGAAADNRRGCLALLVELGRDADALVPEFRGRLRTDADAHDASAFLSAAEQRRTRAALLAIGGGPAVAALPPSLVPDFVERLCNPSGHQRDRGLAHNEAVGRAVSDNFAQALPHLLAVLRGDSVQRRNAVLGYLAQHYAGSAQSLGHFRDIDLDRAVPPDLIRAVAGLLESPETRAHAIRVLGEIGPPARSAVPDLLLGLDEERLRQTLLAIVNVGGVDPRQGARFDGVRGAFAAAPRRALVDRLKTESRKINGEEFAPLMVLLLLRESVEETVGVLRERQKAWADGPSPVGDRERTERFIQSLAAADLVLFAHLLDGGVSFSYPPVHDYHTGPEGRRFVPVLLKLLEQKRGVPAVTDALAALCRDETPKEVGDAIFRQLERPGWDQWQLVELLRTLARIAPTAEGGTVPAALRESKELRTRRFSAAAALRWNPKDADARKVVLDWADAAPPKDPASGQAFGLGPLATFDLAPVAALAPIAPDDPNALAALVKFLEMLRLSTPLDITDPRTHRDADSTLGTVLACGKAGVEAIVSRFLQTKDDGLAVVLRRLAAEGKVLLPDVFARLRPAVAALRGARSTTDAQHREKQQAFTGLRSVTTDETAPDFLELAAALWESHESWLEWAEEPYGRRERRARYSLGELAANPVLRRWLVEPGGPRADLAYYVLSATHPADPDVWKVTARRAVDSRTASLWTTERAIRHTGPKGIPVVRMQMDLFGEKDPARDLSYLLPHLPERYTELLLADPDPRVRAAAVRSVVERRRIDHANPTQRELEEAALAAVRILATVLSKDEDDTVRAAAWRGINYLAHSHTRRARLLEALTPEERAAWLAQPVARWRKHSAQADGEIEYVRVPLEAWLESMDVADTPVLRPIRDALDELLPPPAPLPDAPPANKLGERLLSLGSDRPAGRRQVRAELVRRAAEPGAAEGLVRAITRDADGQLKSALDRSAFGTLRRLGPHALPALLAWLDRLDRPLNRPGEMFVLVGQGHEELLDVLGDIGPAAKGAVPLLLVHAGDPRSERRLAARDALRKIAPEAAAELE